jgi:uncharacterized membrane protein
MSGAASHGGAGRLGPPDDGPSSSFPSRRAWRRLAVGVGAGVLGWAAAPGQYGSAVKLISAWDAGALAMTALAWSFIARATPTRTRQWAAAIDPGRLAIGGFVIIASAFSLLATGYALRGARTCPLGGRNIFLGLGLLAVASAWLVTHTMYTLRYAHLYYRDGVEREGGLAFPGGGHPSYFDFAYYAFTLGMCFQVSDVTVTNPRMRRETLAHALLSFIYNTVILAVALNFAMGTFG